MQEKPFCSVLIVNFNGLHHVNKCFSSLAGLDYPKDRYEVVMVDNSSTDGSVDFVRKHFPWVKVHEFDKNYGFAEGNNRGLQFLKRGEYVVFLNNDTMVRRDWLSELVKAADASDDVGICGSKMLDQRLKADIGEGRMNLLVVPEIISRHTETSECFFVSGGSMLVKREVLNRLGQCFDSEFVAYFEDVDLCWRARLAGYKVLYVPSSEVVHKGGVLTKPKPEQKPQINRMKFYHYRNKIWSFRKNTRAPLTQLLMVPLAAVTVLQAVRMTVFEGWDLGITALKCMFSEKRKSAGIEKVPLKKQLSLLLG
ncbi:MAG: glycosyltransferase family 2 protein [Candidatus Aenigmarchaeota archaeon]|nr:glycosyltransferase family 2 protein [Candidatus Aenigmarchaeota archaeon]